jgi:hypothetical protein
MASLRWSILLLTNNIPTYFSISSLTCVWMAAPHLSFSQIERSIKNILSYPGKPV